jgi:hypothetical protein
MEETLQPQEGMNPELEIGVEETITEETDETLEVEETVPKSQFNQALARAKKAEAQLKQKVQAPVINQNQNAPTDEQVEVKILKALGRSDDEITYLKKLAKVNEISLLDAQSDELFISFQKKREDEGKAQKAKLGASRGSGQVKKEVQISSPGLTKEQHKALWNG